MQENEGKFVTYGTHSYTDYHESMSDARGLIEYPQSRFHPRYVRSRMTELEKGKDTKPRWVKYCKPSCMAQEQMLRRCENALSIVSRSDPEKTCLYRYRNWFECIENCAAPKVFYHLKGSSRRGPLDWFKAHGPEYH